MQSFLDLFSRLSDERYFCGDNLDKAFIQFCYMDVIQVMRHTTSYKIFNLFTFTPFLSRNALSAKRGLAIACRPSTCPSVCL